MNDLSLVAQVSLFHNKRAFDQLVCKYQSPLRRFFMNLTLGDAQLCDDLAQETFIKAYTHITSFRGGAAFSTWLFRIGHRVFFDYKRSLKLTDDIATVSSKSLYQGGSTSGLVSPHSTSSDPSLSIDLYRAMQILKEEERTCITLQVIEGFPIDKIATITGLPAGTVKSHLSRGKKRLAEYLKKNGYGKS